MTKKTDFWTDKITLKVDYFIQHLKRNHDKYGIRQVQVDHAIQLSQELLSDNLLAYFETLPSNYQKAFKSAWRQRQYKESGKGKKTVEMTYEAASFLNSIVDEYEKLKPDHGIKNKADLVTEALAEAFFALMDRRTRKENNIDL